MVILTLLGIALSVLGVGFIMLLAVSAWAIVDAFLIPGWIRSINMELAAKLTSGALPR